MTSELRRGGFDRVEPRFLPEDWEVVRFIKALKRYKDYLRQKYKVREISVFGSYAKNEQKRGKQHDIFMEGQ